MNDIYFIFSVLVSTTVDPTSDPDPEFECPADGEQCVDDRYPYPTDCSLYYHCFTNCTVEIYSCPDGLDFSPEFGECGDPDFVQCQGKV